MRRRDFMIGVGGVGAVLLSSRAAHAQQASRQVGVLTVGNADAQAFGTALRDSLRASGYVEGQNIRYEFRSADGNLSHLPKLAAELVALKVDVIVALFTPCAIAAKGATTAIPIVTVSGDPLALGLIGSLARPGGNVTGISLVAGEMHGKCIELFRDLLPAARRVAFLGYSADPFIKRIVEEIRTAGRTTGLATPEVVIAKPEEIDAALASIKKEGHDAVVVQASLPARQVADSALKHGLPAATMSRSFAEVGGLLAYGADGPEVFRHSAGFVTRILRGAAPADMPVEQPTKFEMVLNLKTAKTLGLKIADAFLLRADTVIE